MSIDVCYLVSHGFAARMVLQSGLVPALKQAGLSTAIVLPHAADAAARQITDRHGIPVFVAPPLEDRSRREYAILRRYLFENVRTNPALWSGHQIQRRLSLKRQLRLDTYMLVNHLSVRSKLIRSGLEAIERLMLASHAASEMLRQLSPRAVVSTYPVSSMESHFVFEANRMGLTTVGHLLSWDNITSKGRFPSPPNFFLTWGPIMSEEAAEYYGHSTDKVYECGVAHFDLHLEPRSPETGAGHLRTLGLEPGDPYMFFGMSSPEIAPMEIDIVEKLAQMVREDVFGSRMQLVIRPHPQNAEGSGSSWFSRLDALKGPRVGINLPAMSNSGLSWYLEEHDMEVLVCLIDGSSVTLNSGSTLTIDAMVQDKPVVVTAFDGDSVLPWYRSVSRVLEFHHLKKLLSFEGASVARSFDDLKNMIDAYIKDPSLHREGRQRAVLAECGTLGDTPSRIAEALKDILSGALDSDSSAVALSASV